MTRRLVLRLSRHYAGRTLAAELAATDDTGLRQAARRAGRIVVTRPSTSGPAASQPRTESIPATVVLFRRGHVEDSARPHSALTPTEYASGVTTASPSPARRRETPRMSLEAERL